MSKGCDPEEICEECPEWIFTLADLLMCMMGLFVIMWVLKPDAAEAGGGEIAELQEQIVIMDTVMDIREGFGASEQDLAEDKMTLAEMQARLIRLRRGVADKGHANTPQDGAEGTDPEVENIRSGDSVGAGGKVNFDAGQIQPSPEDMDKIAEIAEEIRGHRNLVMVKGHTSPDDLPDGATDEQHWRLSYERARVVADALIAAGVSPDILRLQACGTFEPVRLRAYAEADRLANRRVEVEATDQVVATRAARASEIPAQGSGGQ